MALAASRTHGNVTELESHPSVTKTLWGVGGVAAAAFSQVPSWKPILDITSVLLTISLWLPVVPFLTLWIKLASPGPHCFSAEVRRLLRQTFHDRQLQGNEDERLDAYP